MKIDKTDLIIPLINRDINELKEYSKNELPLSVKQALKNQIHRLNDWIKERQTQNA